MGTLSLQKLHLGVVARRHDATLLQPISHRFAILARAAIVSLSDRCWFLFPVSFFLDLKTPLLHCECCDEKNAALPMTGEAN